MNELHITNYNGVEVIDSREVAEMVDKRHDHLMRDIRSYVAILEEAAESNLGLSVTAPNFGVSDFFLESSYKDGTGRELPCYLITKKGCDMIANKLTGRKGVLFTAAYVTAFEEMRERLSHPTPEVSPSGLARLIHTNREIMLAVGKNDFDVHSMMQSIYRAWNIPMPEQFYKPVHDPARDQLLLSMWEQETKALAE